MYYLEALYFLNPVLIAFVLTLILAALLPAGFMKMPYNLVALIGSLALAIRGCKGLCHKLDTSYFTDIVVNDAVTSFSCLFLGIAAFVFFTMAPRYLDRKGIHSGEFYLLSLVSLSGMVLTVSTRHFTGLIMGIETMTIPLYFIIAMDKSHNEGRLAALKYLILGGVGSSILIYGVALIYGDSGSLAYSAISSSAPTHLFTIGATFLLGGFLFKTGAFPFHAWVPDVYGSSPTPLTGFMATTVKLTAVIAMYNLFIPLIDHSDIIRDSLLPVIAIITMTLGNLMALRHNKPKLVLAYSSIAHTGYLLVGFCSGSEMGSSGILYYLAVYVLMTLGAFAVLSSVPDDDPKFLQGIVHRKPILAIIFAICILSLAGVPPFGGFIGKFFVFQGAWATEHYILVGAAILNSLIALGYYIPLVRWVLFEEPGSTQDQTSSSIYLYLSCFICAAGVIVTGVYPMWLSKMIALIVT